MSHFQKLELWQKCRVLVRDVYRETGPFPRREIFGLTQQMRRAAVSVLCNIAEAHGRLTPVERIHFFTISRGSLLELEAQVVLSADLEFMQPPRAEQLVRQITEVTRLLNGLIRFYRRQSGSREPLTASGEAAYRPPRAANAAD